MISSQKEEIRFLRVDKAAITSQGKEQASPASKKDGWKMKADIVKGLVFLSYIAYTTQHLDLLRLVQDGHHSGADCTMGWQLGMGIERNLPDMEVSNVHLRTVYDKCFQQKCVIIGFLVNPPSSC